MASEGRRKRAETIRGVEDQEGSAGFVGWLIWKSSLGTLQCCWKNVGTRERLMMRSGPLGVQGPKKGVWRSRPPMKHFGLCQVGQTSASDGQRWGWADEGKSKEQWESYRWKAYLADLSLHFPTPFFCLDVWHRTHLLHSVLLCLQLIFFLFFQIITNLPHFA